MANDKSPPDPRHLAQAIFTRSGGAAPLYQAMLQPGDPAVCLGRYAGALVRRALQNGEIQAAQSSACRDYLLELLELVCQELGLSLDPQDPFPD